MEADNGEYSRAIYNSSDQESNSRAGGPGLLMLSASKNNVLSKPMAAHADKEMIFSC